MCGNLRNSFEWFPDDWGAIDLAANWGAIDLAANWGAIDLAANWGAIDLAANHINQCITALEQL